MSRLAEKRAAQRNVDPRLFGLLRRYGRRYYIDGDLLIFLGERMVPEDEAQSNEVRRIKNTMVVIAGDGTVKTVWKDARALKKLRRRKLARLRITRRTGRSRRYWLH